MLRVQFPHRAICAGSSVIAICSAAVFAFVVMAFAVPSPAPAQGFFDFWNSNSSQSKAGAINRRKQQAKRISPNSADPEAQAAAVSATREAEASKGKNREKTDVVVNDGPLEHPLVIVVSLKRQRATVYDGGKIIAVTPISSGSSSRPTPMGVYSILEKQVIHYSNLYDSAPMPNMQRITWSGVAMHAGVLPGYPASHGCIRLPAGFAKRLYGMTKTGQRVIVMRDDAVPQLFSHPALFEAFPAEQAIVAANQKVADASDVIYRPKGASTSGLITTAAAAPETGSIEKPRRSKYREAWLAEMAKRTQDVIDADAERKAATANLADANIQATAARDILKAARSEAQRLSSNAKKSDADRIAAEKSLDQFAQGVMKQDRLTDEEAAKAALREEELDAAISKISASATDANDDAIEATEGVQTALAEAGRAETALKAAKDRLAKADAAIKTTKIADDAAKRREAKRSKVVHMLISRKTSTLYVRQGQETILESPVTISDPNRTMGTHVFTALSIAENQKNVNWSVVSVLTPASTVKAAKDDRSKDRTKQVEVAPVADSSQQTAAGALDRITIPDDVREQISDVMKPGSSLIVSDYGVGNETGPFTDIIIPLR